MSETVAKSQQTHSKQSPSVAVENLTLRYSDGTTAVDDASLTIPRGEFFGFLGPNGAGKTTTIKVLATLLEPTSGQVRVNGYDVVTNQDAVRSTIGYMAQSVSIDEDLTARENLHFACDAYGIRSDDRVDRIDELLELVDLADVAETPAANFSGGMKKRLDAATALVHDPELVFLDEPTTGLDPKARNRLWEYFERINDEGTTIFLTTQYLEEADALCERLAVIRDGKIVEDDTPAALKRRVGGTSLAVNIDGGPDDIEAATDRCRTFFDTDPTVETTQEGIRVTSEQAKDKGTDLLVALRDAGIDVTGFDIEDVTLDDVFFALADPTDEREAIDGGNS